MIRPLVRRLTGLVRNFTRRSDARSYCRLTGEMLEPRSMLATMAEAFSIVVPSNHAAKDGSGQNILPFGTTTPRRHQQIYSASEFSSGGIIDNISFRRDKNQAPF